MSEELWANGEPVEINKVAAELREHLAEADGLTISGGEPMNQATPLRELIQVLRQSNSVEVLIYSGYKPEDLRRRTDAAALLDEIDMLIDGPFMVHQPATRLWRGSDNQRLHLLSIRAKERYGYAVTAQRNGQRPIGVQFLADDTVRLIGIPERGDLERIRQGLAQRGIMLNKADVPR